MKNVFAIFLGLFAATAVSAEPYITHVNDARPGYAMVVTGGDFDPQSVQVVVHVPGNLTSERDAIPATVESLAADYTDGEYELPAQPPTERTHVLRPFRATERSVFVRLPGHPYPPGYVAVVWLRDGERLSRPVLVNRPEAWFLLKTTSRPGEINRLCGVNLRGDRYVPRYLMIRGENGQPTPLAEIPRHKEDGVSENFCVEFRLPDDLPPGRYEVFLHNNSGEKYGFTRPLPLTVTTEPEFPQNLFIATEHGLVGDSMTDNRDALQSLIDQVGEAGGGIIFLPAGSYRIDDTVQMRANVVLRGAGRDATTIFYGGQPSEKKRSLWLISARDVDHTGFEDLTIRVSHPFQYALSYYAGGRPSYDTHLRRCRIVGGTVGIHYNIGMEVGDCIFEGGRFFAHNLKQGWVHDCSFTLGRLRGSPVALWGTENCTIENNRSFGSNRGFVWQNHGVLGHYHNLIDANVVEETRLGANAGETYLFEGSGFKWFGPPAEIRADGFSASSVKWDADSLVNAFAVVTAGRGLGQYRRIISNTETDVTLAEPWRVTPSGDLRISILNGVVENAICNNRHIDCDNSMMFYAAGMIGNRIFRNRSENSLGISVWSRAEADGNVLVPDYYNIFDGNVCEDQGGVWLTRLGDIKQTDGVRNLGNVFRDTFLSDVRRKRENHYNNVWEETRRGSYRPVQAAFWCDIGRSYDKDPTQSPIWLDTLIERNYITRCELGVELRAISGETVVVGNTFYDVARPILDEGEDTFISDNRFEPVDEGE